MGHDTIRIQEKTAVFFMWDHHCIMHDHAAACPGFCRDREREHSGRNCRTGSLRERSLRAESFGAGNFGAGNFGIRNFRAGNFGTRNFRAGNLGIRNFRV